MLTLNCLVFSGWTDGQIFLDVGMLLNSVHQNLEMGCRFEHFGVVFARRWMREEHVISYFSPSHLNYFKSGYYSSIRKYTYSVITSFPTRYPLFFAKTASILTKLGEIDSAKNFCIISCCLSASFSLIAAYPATYISLEINYLHTLN